MILELTVELQASSPKKKIVFKHLDFINRFNNITFKYARFPSFSFVAVYNPLKFLIPPMRVVRYFQPLKDPKPNMLCHVTLKKLLY